MLVPIQRHSTTGDETSSLCTFCPQVIQESTYHVLIPMITFDYAFHTSSTQPTPCTDFSDSHHMMHSQLWHSLVSLENQDFLLNFTCIHENLYAWSHRSFFTSKNNNKISVTNISTIALEFCFREYTHIFISKWSIVSIKQGVCPISFLSFSFFQMVSPMDQLPYYVYNLMMLHCINSRSIASFDQYH